jgi:general stress protein 26
MLRHRGDDSLIAFLDEPLEIVECRSQSRTREWISVSGLATISRDRQKIRELYAPDWKMWFPGRG